MANYQIFTDSSCDLCKELRAQNNIKYFQMGIYVKEQLYPADLDWEAYSPEQLYAWIEDLNNHCRTNLVSMAEFIDKMTPVLKAGTDILYIGCSSALTGTLNVFNIVKEQLLEQFPDRKIMCVDSLTASGTLGMLVLGAAAQQQAGKTIEEVAAWTEENKFFFNQIAGVETLTYLRAAGRIKAAKAFIGNIIGLKPLFISDRKGNNFVIAKVRGSQKMLDYVFEDMKAKVHKEKCNKIFIVHGRALPNALKLKERFEKELGCEVFINWAGPIIGITCGPGLIGCFCYGEEVTRFDGDGK